MNAFTIRVNDDAFVEIEKFCEKMGCSRNAAVQMLLNFGLLYATNQGIISSPSETDE